MLKTKKNVLILTGYSNGSTNFYSHIAIACSNTIFLLLFQGLSGHNLYRYTWFLLAAILLLTEYFALIDFYGNQKKIVDD